jgi:hypothetical protein
MITILLILIAITLTKMRKAWNYSKALFDKKYIWAELYELGKMFLTVLFIWGLIKFDLVVMLIRWMF